MKQTPMPPRTRPLVATTELRRTTGLSRGTGLERGAWGRPVPLVKNAATRRAPAAPRRAESFPKAVAALIDARDPWCIHCGSTRNLQRHHRRVKGAGGDPRPHTDCACNGVRLCLSCHIPWAHGEGRREAETEGLIIPRATVQPWTESVLVHMEADRGGARKFPTCDGRWLDYRPEVAA